MEKQISLIIIIISLVAVSGCIQPEGARTPGEIYSQKTIQLQEEISDYSVTVEEQLQNGGPTLTREILVKRPYMYRIKDSQNCAFISNGTVLWSYCNESDNLKSFADPSVRGFIADVDYQQIFTYMLGAGPVIMAGNDTIDGTSAWILETTPPRTIPYHLRYDYDSVRLWVDENTGMILRAEMIPANATNIGIIRFSNITINQGIPDDAFTFTPRSGMNITQGPSKGLYKESLDRASGYTIAATPCTNCPLPISTPLP